MLEQIHQITGEQLNLRYSAVRPGDQPLYISDTTNIERATGWRARRSIAQTLKHIHSFWHANSDIIAGPHALASSPEMLTEEVA
jgi:CDP-paratose 2-epimerase